MRGTTRMLETTTMKRRTLLSGGLACVVASVIPTDYSRISKCRGNLGQIFMSFPARKRDNRLRHYVARHAERKLSGEGHAGKQSWSVHLPANTADAGSWDQDESRIFAGNLLEHTGAVIIEAPNRRFHGGGTIDVWAERTTPTGFHQRIGSPFVAALVAEDQELAKRYQTLLPEEDRVALTRDIARAITARARKHGIVDDPDAYGRRLAARLLPDVLHYNPELPAGFTFAGQNGRHPGEAAALVVDTILNGSPAFSSEQAPPRLQTRFPYFSQA